MHAVLRCCTCPTFATSVALVSAVRGCSHTASSIPREVSPEPTIAPKRPRRRVVSRLDVEDLIKHVPSEPGAHAELSTAELERKLEEWSRLHPKQLEEVLKQFEAKEEESSRVLAEDSLYQMDVSLKPRASSAVRVFWTDVGVTALDQLPGWYTVTVDGRKVKAFESSQILAIPSEAMAYCCAKEYSEQTGHLNKLLMPMTDICSGALHVSPQMILPRIEYLMSFFQNDNVYFRAEAIAVQQDAMLAPIVEWFERVFSVHVPRIVGIGHPKLSADAVQRVREELVLLSMNPYQIVSLCVAAQFTSSLILPLALFHGVVDLPTALRINRAEESHNISQSGAVEGYHDIREADVVTKLCACATTWQIMKSVPLAKCLEAPRASTAELDDAH